MTIIYFGRKETSKDDGNVPLANFRIKSVSKLEMSKIVEGAKELVVKPKYRYVVGSERVLKLVP